jgi:uncharacterized membrane protein YoaK (UPF0700 family)
MGGGLAVFICLALGVLMVASMWKLFAKAGQPGWGALVPVYNIILLLKIAGKPAWWLVLFMIPFINFVIIVMVTLSLAKSFGKSSGYGIGLLLLGVVFFPMLAFGSDRYVGTPVLVPATA